LCGQDDTRLLFRARDTLLGRPEFYSIVQCRACGLVYLSPRPSPQAMARHYPADYFNELGGGGVTTTAVRRVLKNVLYRLTGGMARIIESLPPGRVLDVGCGDGRYLAFFRDLGWETYGTDPSPVAVERARARGLDVADPGELGEARLPERRFDLVVLRYTLENMHHPAVTLREVRRVLKDDGKVFVSAPSVSSPVARVFRQYCAYVEAPRHLYFFSPATLPALLARTGFRVVRLARVAWPSLVRDVVNRLSGGRYRGLLARRWVSRGVWLAGVPASLLLAYVGLNRGNLEVVAEKNVRLA
ncbi:MAG: class I SAM-dependent methyltransferase, partial [Acidobacteria bacterium]|nr:class I SAM-dependent methyltransferase [Acidobacteriota bacterium]